MTKKTSLSRILDTLRERLCASPLMDESGFVRKLEAAYRNVWRH